MFWKRSKQKHTCVSFYDVILLFKRLQGVRRYLKITKFEHTYFIHNPFCASDFHMNLWYRVFKNVIGSSILDLPGFAMLQCHWAAVHMVLFFVSILYFSVWSSSHCLYLLYSSLKCYKHSVWRKVVD